MLRCAALCDCSHTGQYAAHPKGPRALPDGLMLGFHFFLAAALLRQRRRRILCFLVVHGFGFNG
jgi:hypothetical protein